MSEKNADRSPDRLLNPFHAGWRRFKDAEYDWRLFKETAERTIPALIALNPDFAALKAFCGFYCDLGIETTVQVEFANRIMGRTTLKGATASENGATLVYSFGPTGWVAVILYPPKSELGRVIEDHLYLRIVPASAANLLEKLPRDLRDLVRYERVASLDGTPRLSERLRIAWLRYWSRMQVNGQTKAARSIEHLNLVVEFSTGKLVFAMAMAILKPVGVLIVVYLLIRFGMPHLAQLLVRQV